LIGVENSSVEVSENIGLGLDLTLNEVVLALIVQDEVDTLGETTHIRAEHDADVSSSAKAKRVNPS